MRRDEIKVDWTYGHPTAGFDFINFTYIYHFNQVEFRPGNVLKSTPRYLTRIIHRHRGTDYRALIIKGYCD